jgi:hypothetical protein
MPEARLELTLPEQLWVGKLSRAHPEASFRVLAVMPDGAAGIGLVEIRAQHVEALLAEMRDYEGVTAVEVLSATDQKALVQFETSTPLLLLVAQDSGVPLELPFAFSNGTAVWELTAPSDRLAELGTQLRTLDIQFTLDSLKHEVERESMLTDSQERLVRRAVEAGYYDTPRECSLTDLAAEFDLAKSTVSETLHRAEGRILKSFVDEHSTAR